MSWSRRVRMTVAAATAVLATAVFAPPAQAEPVARFTASRLSVRAGLVVTFDAQRSVCDVAPCRYVWRWYRAPSATSVDRSGTSMGEGAVITYAWSTPGLKTVVLKVVNATTTHSANTRQRVVTVR